MENKMVHFAYLPTASVLFATMSTVNALHQQSSDHDLEENHWRTPTMIAVGCVAVAVLAYRCLCPLQPTVQPLPTTVQSLPMGGQPPHQTIPSFLDAEIKNLLGVRLRVKKSFPITIYTVAIHATSADTLFVSLRAQRNTQGTPLSPQDASELVARNACDRLCSSGMSGCKLEKTKSGYWIVTVPVASILPMLFPNDRTALAQIFSGSRTPLPTPMPLAAS